ncbi:MAG: SLBB domain-containing protein [Cyanobacteria bacterium P01_A01_bin.114]
MEKPKPIYLKSIFWAIPAAFALASAPLSAEAANAARAAGAEELRHHGVSSENHRQAGTSQLAAAPSVQLAAAPSVQLAAAPSVYEAAYTLDAGDLIQIDILRVPQYSGEQEVLIDGSLNLPVVGQLSVRGLTLEQAKIAIANAYSEILRRPHVTVSLLSPRPLRVGIAGEIDSPGSYTIERNGSQFPTLVSLLQTAGGINQTADLRRVQVRRIEASGRNIVINVDLWQFLQTGDLRYDLTLRDGDTVFVPTSDTFDATENFQLLASNFAADGSQPLNVVVVGEVFRPGPHTVAGVADVAQAGVEGSSSSAATVPPTITRAVQVAGGIKPLANVREIEVRRQTRLGTEQTIQVDLWALLQEGDLSQDLVLQEGDRVFVPTAEAIDTSEITEIASASFSPDIISVNVVGEVERPGSVQVPPNTPLNQALLAAGGFNNRARRGSVELIRLNQNGTVDRQAIPVDFAENLNEQNNPALRNNDVLIVRRSTTANISDVLQGLVQPFSSFFTLFRLFEIF